MDLMMPAKELMELLAAYITAKLLDYVIQALHITVDAVYGWSDSQITLAWIRRPILTQILQAMVERSTLVTTAMQSLAC